MSQFLQIPFSREKILFYLGLYLEKSRQDQKNYTSKNETKMSKQTQKEKTTQKLAPKLWLSAFLEFFLVLRYILILVEKNLHTKSR